MRSLVNLPASHVGAQTEILMSTLFGGGTAVLLEIFDAARSLRAIEQHRVEILGQIPVMFNLEWMLKDYGSYDLRHARPCQDAARQVPGHGPRRPVRADPVHARPAAERRRGHHGLPAEDRRVQPAPRPDLRQPRARRRDQPRARQGAERAPRGDAGAPGDDRRPDPPPAEPVLRHGDPEPDRAGGHLPAARGADRPLPLQAPRRTTRAPSRRRR